jgi:uncharacterized protein Yka (UPF0111/DUF47 family)
VEVKFSEYFQLATQNLLEAARLLQELFDDFHDMPDTFARIEELEHRGDRILHEVNNLLVRTLVTPFSSDEIQHLIDAVDNTLDTIHAVGVRMVAYQVCETRPAAQALAHLITEGAAELDRAMRSLQDKRLYPQVKQHIVCIHTIENQADDVFGEALSELFAQRGDIFDFIRWKEIYELLEKGTDRLEDAGDVLQRVIVANA